MQIIEVTFLLTEELAKQLAKGQLFGLIADANSGRVVKWLTPIAFKASRRIKWGRYAIAAVAVAGTAAGAIVVYTRFNRKARLASKLRRVKTTVQERVQEHATELTREDLCRIRASIDEFLAFSAQPQYTGVTLEVPEHAKQLLIGLADALRAFSERLKALAKSQELIPGIEASPNSMDLASLLRAIRSQIEYQDRNWPKA